MNDHGRAGALPASDRIGAPPISVGDPTAFALKTMTCEQRKAISLERHHIQSAAPFPGVSPVSLPRGENLS